MIVATLISTVCCAITSSPRDPLLDLSDLAEVIAEPAAEAGPPNGGRPLSLPATRAAMARAAELLRRGRDAEAASLLEHLGPDPLIGPYAELLRSAALVALGDLDKAERLIERLEKSPDEAVAHLAERRRADLDLRRGRFADVARRLTRLIGAPGGEFRSPDPGFWLELGQALEGAGQSEQAAGAFRTARWTAPSSTPGLEAARHLRDLEARGVVPRTLAIADLSVRVSQLLQRAEPELALEVLHASGPEASWPVELEALAALTVHALGDEPQARLHWQRVAGSGDPRLAAEGGIAWARSTDSAGDVEGALTRLATLTGDPRRGAEASYLMGRLQLQHGRRDEAIASFTSAAGWRYQRYADEACWWLGWAHFGAGHFALAVAAWDRLARDWPGSALIVPGLYWKARALEESGAWKEAETIRDGLSARAPGSYYAVLADRAVPAAFRADPDCCPSRWVAQSTPFSLALQRAALLEGLHLSTFASGELAVAERKARGPAEAWALARFEAELGAGGGSGRAFQHILGPAAACIPSAWPSAPLYPRVANAEVEAAARTMGIDPLWIYTLMRRESRFDERARSPAGAVGLLQMLPVTGARIAAAAGVKPPDLTEPAQALWFAAWYLRALSERFGGNFALVAAAYDAGPEAVASWAEARGDRRLDEFVEEIPFRETRAYVKEVVANLAAYQALYGSGRLEGLAGTRPGAQPRPGVSF